MNVLPLRNSIASVGLVEKVQRVVRVKCHAADVRRADRDQSIDEVLLGKVENQEDVVVRQLCIVAVDVSEECRLRASTSSILHFRNDLKLSGSASGTSTSRGFSKWP